jgi:signal transduction histidine kinase
MLNGGGAVPDEHPFVLSSLAPSQAQKRLAVGIVLGLLIALYMVLVPFGGLQLGVVRSFVAVYATAMFVTDFITAVLLFAQFSVLRSRAVLVIASGYLFTALLIVPYAVAFPGVFAPDGVVGDVQTSARLYLVWHSGFPLFVIAYAMLKDETPGERVPHERVGEAILRSVLGTAAVAGLITWSCVVGSAPLPRIMADAGSFVPDWPLVVGMPVVVSCTTALIVLWLRRRSVLDWFLMVVLCAYLIEIPPHWYPAPARFSTGWYAVRVTGFLSSTIVLIVLLFEITALYSAILRAVVGRRREREARIVTGDAVAGTIAHEIRQPLTAMVTSADAGLRFLDRPDPNLSRAKDAFARIVADGHRVGEVVANIQANFKSEVGARAVLDFESLIAGALALTQSELQRHRIVVEVESSLVLPEVHGNSVQLQQVLSNLVTNAIEAMKAVVEPRVLKIRSEAHNGGSVLISVTDTGPGISPEALPRIFVPLYSTTTHGMGLGLPICRAIVEAHDGRLWFTPNAPSGASFRFTLPTSALPPTPRDQHVAGYGR